VTLVTVGTLVSITMALRPAMSWPAGMVRVQSFPAAVAERAGDRESGLIEFRSGELWPAATTYVPAALAAGPKGAMETTAPVSSVTRRFPPASVTGSEKFTVTLIEAATV
jgi:hypothetical protein